MNSTITPSLNLRDGVRTKIFKAFVSHLMEDPILKNVIRLWDDYSGGAEDFKVVSIEQMPALRFGISAPAMSPDTFSSHSASFSIDIEVCVPGTNQFDMLNLWEAVEEAIAPFCTGDRNIIRKIGNDSRVVYGTHYFSGTPVSHQKYSAPPCMVGTGTIVFVLSIRR